MGPRRAPSPSCANADAAAASAFATAYPLNQNSQLLPLTATLNGTPAAFGSIPPGARIVLEASWPAASAETFAYFDPASGTVTSQRESIQVAWYVSAGHLDTESTGRAGADDETRSDNGWTAPSAPGTAHLWRSFVTVAAGSTLRNTTW